MRINIKIFTVALLVLLCLALTSCGFVSFVRYEDDALEATKNEYIALLQAMCNENDYFEEERREYVLTLIEIENLIRECTSFEDILAIFEKYTQILGDIPLNIELTRARIYEEIKKLAGENLYRPEQQISVEWLIDYFKDLIDNCKSVRECESLLADFQTRLGYIKTDAQLYSEELAALKKELSLEFGTTINYALYRAKERAQLESLVKGFQTSVQGAQTLEECEAIFSACAKQIVSVPQSSMLLAQEREEWQNRWDSELNNFARKYSLNLEKEIKSTLSLIAAQKTEYAANALASEFMLEEAVKIGDRAFSDAKSAASLYISNITDARDYREDEQETLFANIDDATKQISSCDNFDGLFSIISQLEEKVDQIATNDELWQKEDEEFVLYMSDKYGTLALHAPESLTLAKSTEELAKIIDYYAFYQLDGENFERGTFRVQLDFLHNFADYIIKDVYWYCELLRSAVGISGEFEGDTSNLIITLHPYELATKTNKNRLEGVQRHDSLIEYSSDSDYSDRAEDFEAFPYLELYEGRYVKVWNSQQLWYALEHEYIPVPVENSPADAVLERAKEILRDIIKDGMSIEEKVFAIYSWYSDNVYYDYEYSNYMAVELRENFPDVLVSGLRSFHAEGALFDNLAVCCSYAKSTLILMRLEGIEAYRVILHLYEENAIDNLGQGGYGSHAIITFRASDDKFYYCDTEQCAAGDGLKYEKYMQVMVTAKEQSPYNNAIDRIWHDLDYGEEFPMELLWKNLEYNGNSLFVKSEDDLKKIIDEFCKLEDSSKQINIFSHGTADFDIGKWLDGDARIEYHYAVFGGFYEYMISYVGKAQ